MSIGNFMFYILLFMGPLVSLSSSNWVICWVGLELSFLGAIPLFLGDGGFMSLNKESIIKYFCIQALGSGFLMLGGVYYYLLPFFCWVAEGVFLFSLFIKLGVFPFHFWVPSVVAGLNWFPMFILLGWQKIPPFALLVNLMENVNWLINLVLLVGGMSALVGALIGLNQTSLRAMMGGSSIAHTGWGCIGTIFGGIWSYFFIYCLSLAVCLFSLFVGDNFMSSMSILSLSGLPPFMMFIGKWVVLKTALSGGVNFMYLLFPVLGALFSLFFYLKFAYSFYLKSKSEPIIFKYSSFCSIFFFVGSGVVFTLLF